MEDWCFGPEHGTSALAKDMLVLGLLEVGGQSGHKHDGMCGADRKGIF